MSTIAELRAYVRRQTETTSSELDDLTIDPYLQEAFNRTVAAETQWPSYEETWTVAQGIGDNFATMPVNVDTVMSLVDTANDNHRLLMIDYEAAEDDYFGAVATTGYAHEYSVWKNTIHFWPMVTFTAVRSYRMRGYRTPTDWLAGPSTDEPDCDSRLHLPLAHYAIALAYAKQEDETLENTYMLRWQKDVEIARMAIMDPGHHRPLMMGPRRYGRVGRGGGRRNYTIQTP